jgi:hypothetical protein
VPNLEVGSYGLGIAFLVPEPCRFGRVTSDPRLRSSGFGPIEPI